MKVFLLSLVLCATISYTHQYESRQEELLYKIQSLATSKRDPQDYMYLLHAVNYIIFGPDYQKPGTIDTILTAPDNLDLYSMIVIGSQNLFLKLSELNYDNVTLNEMWNDWIYVLGTLILQGADNVLLEDLKPFINLLRFQNLYALWSANSNTGTNFKLYLQNVFLAGLSPLCKRYVGLWFNDIQSLKGWALSTFDATGKLPVALQNGNINWPGDYKLCKKVAVNLTNQEKPDFTGKYCRTTLTIPPALLESGGVPVSDNIGISIGMCVPDTCSNEDVKIIADNTLKLLTLHQIIPVKSVKCDYDKPFSNAFLAYVTILGFIIAVCILSTIVDGVYRTIRSEDDSSIEKIDKVIEMKSEIAGTDVIEKKNQIKTNKEKHNRFFQFILNCSMYTNSERIFRTDNGGKYTCLNGIRAISMVWIIMSHTFNYLGDTTYFFLISNILDIKELEELPIAQLIINGMYGVDTFFLMSSFLLTISFMKKLQKNNKLTLFEWGYYYVHRYWRLIPPYIIIIAIYIYILPWVGEGPLWLTDEFPLKNKDCHDYWWAYLILLNNFIPNGKGTTCMGYLWYVPNDYQLYAISPIYLIILFKFPLAGIGFLLLTLLGCTAILAFLTANVYISNSQSIIPTLVGIWENVYIKPYCRAAPWILGIYLGYFFFKNQKIKLNKFVVLFGWLLSTILALATVFGGFTNHEKGGRRMEVGEYAIYFSVTRISWSLSIGWIIFACHYGYGGVINRFLSSRAFIPLTRVSYCAYLIHPVIMVTYLFTQGNLLYATWPTLLYLFIGHTIFTFIFAFFFTLFFEQPFVALEKLIMSFLKNDSNHE